VPATGRDVKVAAVPELDAYAMALPYLDYVLELAVDSVVLGRDSIVPVKIPRAERFALHKLLVSQLRGSTSDKKTKDLQQAAVLVAALAETDAGALEEALGVFPRSAKAKLRRGATQALDTLERAGHERGSEAMKRVARA
jgi:hypothetical protein